MQETKCVHKSMQFGSIDAVIWMVFWVACSLDAVGFYATPRTHYFQIRAMEKEGKSMINNLQ